MKKFGMFAVAVLMASTFSQAQAGTEGSTASFDGGVLTIEGAAAMSLYNSLTGAENMENASAIPNSTWKYRVGKGVRCDKMEVRGEKTEFRCDISIEADGTINTPAVG